MVPAGTKASASSAGTRPLPMLTVAEARPGLSASVTVRPASTAVATCSGARVAPAVAVSTGACSTAKAGLLAVPPGVVRVLVPVAVAPAGTLKVRAVPVLLRMGAAAPLMTRAVAPARLVPLRVTRVPGAAGLGLKPVRVGTDARPSSTEALAAPLLAVARSRRPSPFRSARATPLGVAPVA